MKLPWLFILLAPVLIQFDVCPTSAGNAGEISIASAVPVTAPLFTGTAQNKIAVFRINVKNERNQRTIKAMKVAFTGESDSRAIKGISLSCGPSSGNPEKYSVIEAPYKGRKKLYFTKGYEFSNGENKVILNLDLNDNADLNGKMKIMKLEFILDDNSTLPVDISSLPEYRFAKIVRAKGQDGIDTYRIPGLITTSKGTLIAVYDMRRNSSKDLQEDIDIGMSRSTDSGQTWEPMKVIMDMGKYGGFSESQNGIGDPCILYDEKTGAMFVAAMWMSGLSPDKTLWWSSGTGLKPEETGQFMLVKSTDDGLTWSEPFSITEQIKDPAWQLLFQGPGRGITMKDGTLVFPAQFKMDTGEKAIDGGRYTCHSTIVYSSDNGETWKIGSGAKSNTTESQVVELSDGSLMLNMRDDRNRNDKGETNGRAVAVTRDMGKTWKMHPSSNHLLPEPNCQASLISADLKLDGKLKRVLFFSNPADKDSRKNMTIKCSLDEGMTWPEEYQLNLNQDEGFGYSCLTIIDENTIGILYEGVKDLYFQKVRVGDILGKK